MHKIRNNRLISKSQYIIGDSTLSFQVKQVIFPKGLRLRYQFKSKFEKAIVSFLYFKKKQNCSFLSGKFFFISFFFYKKRRRKTLYTRTLTKSNKTENVLK